MRKRKQMRAELCDEWNDCQTALVARTINLTTLGRIKTRRSAVPQIVFQTFIGFSSLRAFIFVPQRIC